MKSNKINEILEALEKQLKEFDAYGDPFLEGFEAGLETAYEIVEKIYKSYE